MSQKKEPQPFKTSSSAEMGLDSYAFSVAPLLGRRVVITGLVAKPHLNWSTGTAVSFDDAKGRYAVKLEKNSSFMIKPSNLSPVTQKNKELAFSMITHDRLGQNADSWANKLPARTCSNTSACASVTAQTIRCFPRLLRLKWVL
jgi:hypothetical protein